MWKGVMGPRGGLRVVLDREYRESTVPQPLYGAVIQVPVGDLQIGGSGDLDPLVFPLNGKTMILARDEDLAGPEVLHRVIPTPVTIEEFGGPATEGEPQQLVSEADPEGRDPRLRQLADVLARVGDSRRIAGPIREEKTPRLERADLGGGGRRRNHHDLAAMLGKHPDDVPLHPEVVRDDP